MSKMLLAGVAALAIALANTAPTLAQTAPARPPDGTYVYTITNVPSVTQTTIVVRTTPKGFSVIENLSVGATPITTQTDYDAQTLLPSHYSIAAHGTLTEVAFANGTGSVLKTNITQTRPPGTKGLTISEGLFSIMSMLPAIVASAHGQHLRYGPRGRHLNRDACAQ